MKAARLRAATFRRIVGTEKGGFVIFIERHQGCQPTRQSRMTRYRPVLGLRQRQPPSQRLHGRGQGGGADSIEGECGAAQCHRINI